MTGETGLTVDASGRAVLLIGICKKTIDHVYLFGKRDPNDHSKQDPIHTWTASPRLTSAGVTRLAMTVQSPPGWTSAQPPPALEPSWLYGAFAQSSDHRAEAAQVSFSTTDLANLNPATVLSVRGRSAVSTFGQDACGKR